MMLAPVPAQQFHVLLNPSSQGLRCSSSSPQVQRPGVQLQNQHKKLNMSMGGDPILKLLDDYAVVDMSRLKQIHARMLRLHLLLRPYSASKLLAAFSLSPFRDLHYALHLFDQISEPNLYTWNTLIRAYASSPNPNISLLLFIRLLTHTAYLPDNFTFPFAIKAAAELSDIRVGAALHGMVLKSPFHSTHVYVLNSLVHFYATCGSLDLALQVFNNTPEKDIVSWNSMIAAFTQAGHFDEALEMFQGMEQLEGTDIVSANEVTMVSVLSACGMKGDLGVWPMGTFLYQPE